MKHLETFRRLLPATRVSVYDEDMVYSFRNKVTAKYFESLAQEIIMSNGLPLTAELNTWSSGGFVLELSMVVKLVREEEMIAL